MLPFLFRYYNDISYLKTINNMEISIIIKYRTSIKCFCCYCLRVLVSGVQEDAEIRTKCKLSSLKLVGIPTSAQ